MASALFDVAVVLFVLVSVYGDYRAGAARALARLAGVLVSLWLLPHVMPGLGAQAGFYAPEIGVLGAVFAVGFMVVLAVTVVMDRLARTFFASDKGRRSSPAGGALGAVRALVLALAVVGASAIAPSPVIREGWERSLLAPPLGAGVRMVALAGLYPQSMEGWMSELHFTEDHQPFSVPESVIVVPLDGLR